MIIQFVKQSSFSLVSSRRPFCAPKHANWQPCSIFGYIHSALHKVTGITLNNQSSSYNVAWVSAWLPSLPGECIDIGGVALTLMFFYYLSADLALFQLLHSLQTCVQKLTFLCAHLSVIASGNEPKPHEEQADDPSSCAAFLQHSCWSHRADAAWVAAVYSTVEILLHSQLMHRYQSFFKTHNHWLQIRF